jgi:hypothetical protein
LVLLFTKVLIIWLSNLSILSVPDEGYYSNVPDEGYYSNVPDEGYYSNVPDEGYKDPRHVVHSQVQVSLVDNGGKQISTHALRKIHFVSGCKVEYFLCVDLVTS